MQLEEEHVLLQVVVDVMHFLYRCVVHLQQLSEAKAAEEMLYPKPQRARVQAAAEVLWVAVLPDVVEVAV